MQRRVYAATAEGGFAPERRSYCLYGSDVRGWRVIRHRVSLSYGRRQVARGLWVEKFNETTWELDGFELISPEAQKGDAAILSLESSRAAITAKEIETWVGCRGI